jgi:hypothetical protein
MRCVELFTEPDKKPIFQWILFRCGYFHRHSANGRTSLFIDTVANNQSNRMVACNYMVRIFSTDACNCLVRIFSTDLAFQFTFVYFFNLNGNYVIFGIFGSTIRPRPSGNPFRSWLNGPFM